MASLSKSEILKNAKSGPYSGILRTEILKLKIKDKKPFIIGSTSSGTKFLAESVNLKDDPITLSYRDSTKKLIKVPISKIFKDPDFGGGGGSGGGSTKTDIQESGQAYYFSLIFNMTRKALTPKDCTNANLKKTASYVTAKINIENFLKNQPEDWIEEQIFLKTANAVYANYATSFRSGSTFFHHGRKSNPFLQKIYNAKKIAQDVDKKVAAQSGKQPLAPASFADDKWNAGDVWISSLAPTSDPFEKLVEKRADWQELNTAVLDKGGELKTKTAVLLGVSLKKTGGVATITKYNQKNRQIVKQSFNGFVFGKNGDFFSSIDMYFKLSSGEIQFRAFNTTSSWQGEVKGSFAAGGKIGGGGVNYYCDKHFKKSIGYKSINNSWSETKPASVDMSNMYKLYKKYNTMQISTGEKIKTVDESTFKKMCKEKGGSFIFSKNMCLLFLDTFMSGSKIDQNNCSTDLLRYASSSTDVSSFFVKVS